MDNEKWTSDTERNIVQSDNSETGFVTSINEQQINEGMSDTIDTKDTLDNITNILDKIDDNVNHDEDAEVTQAQYTESFGYRQESGDIYGQSYGQYTGSSYGSRADSTDGTENTGSEGNAGANFQSGTDTGRSYAGSNAPYSCTTDVQRSAYDRPTDGSGPNVNNANINNNDFNKKKPKHKKKKGLLRRVASFLLAAVVFGGVAGTTLVGVNYAAQKSGIVASSTTAESSGQTASLSNSQVQTTSTSSTTSSDSLDVSGIVSNVMPSVVAITNTQIYENYAQNYGDLYQYFFGGQGGNNGGSNGGNGSNGSSSSDGTYEYEAGSGSGIIISQTDDELLIVTNNHVIEDADSLTITFADESTAKAQVKGTDSDTDLAVVAVDMKDISSDTLSAIKVASLGDSDKCQAGEGVVAIGNALGYGQSVTVGYISALNRTITTSENTTRTVLQTDAAINPGNSGGALINIKGEVIGINCAKYSSTDVEGVGYAIPISLVKDTISELMNQTTKVELSADKQGYLGIKGMTIDNSSATTYGMPTGVYVYSIMENSAASKSDLKEKDIITKFDGTSLSTLEDLQNLLKYYEGGTKVNLTVQSLENGQYAERTVTVTLGYATEKSNDSNNNSNQ